MVLCSLIASITLAPILLLFAVQCSLAGYDWFVKNYYLGTAILLSGLVVMCVFILLGLSMSALSHQLGLLRRVKLLAAREDGRQTFYRVVDHFVGNLVHDCLSHAESAGQKSRPGHPHPHRSQR